jgi:hypothetical protein
VAKPLPHGHWRRFPARAWINLETAVETAEYAEDADFENVVAPHPRGDAAAHPTLLVFRVFRVFRGLKR